jgi:hypothetical protein
MKTKIAIAIGVTTLAVLPLMSAPPVVTVQVPVPAVTVQVPAPAPPAATVEVGVPDTYVWDGTEYVGMVGDQYYYLGPGNVWMTLDPDRVARWHDWEKAHADWHTHAIRNELYRRDAQGHDHPWHDEGPGH